MSDESKALKDMEHAVGAADSLDKKRGASMAWLPGLILIIVGVILLLGNLADLWVADWYVWPFFIIIGGIGVLLSARGD